MTDDSKQINPAELGHRLKFCRRMKRKTLRQVETESGLPNRYLSQLETGKIKNPGVFTLHKLARYYGLSIDELIGVRR